MHTGRDRGGMRHGDARALMGGGLRELEDRQHGPHELGWRSARPAVDSATVWGCEAEVMVCATTTAALCFLAPPFLCRAARSGVSPEDRSASATTLCSCEIWNFAFTTTADLIRKTTCLIKYGGNVCKQQRQWVATCCKLHKYQMHCCSTIQS